MGNSAVSELSFMVVVQRALKTHFRDGSDLGARWCTQASSCNVRFHRHGGWSSRCLQDFKLAHMFILLKEVNQTLMLPCNITYVVDCFGCHGLSGPRSKWRVWLACLVKYIPFSRWINMLEVQNATDTNPKQVYTYTPCFLDPQEDPPNLKIFINSCAMFCCSPTVQTPTP